MKDKTIKAILERANSLKKLCEASLDGVPSNVLAGFRTKVNAAREELEQIKDSFADSLSPHIVLVYVSSDSPEKLEQVKALLVESTEIVVDADFHYSNLTTDIHNFMGRHRKFTIDTFAKLVDMFKDLAKEMELPNGGSLNLPTNLINKEMPLLNDVRDGVAQILSANLGQEVLRRSIVLLTVKEIINKGVSENVPVVFVFGVPPEQVVEVGKKTFSGTFVTLTVKADEEVDRKLVDSVKRTAKKHFDKSTKLENN